MSELEKRETQFSSVLDRGESLVIGHHPASQVDKLDSPYNILQYHVIVQSYFKITHIELSLVNAV